jgi:hypothetical protein
MTEAPRFAIGHTHIVELAQTTRTLAEGQNITFGDCDDGCCIVDFKVPGASGALTATKRHFVVDNHSQHTALKVVNKQYGHGTYYVEPLAANCPIPFARAELSGNNGPALTWIAPGPSTATEIVCAGVPPYINRETKHFKVFQALCEPVLANPQGRPPTFAEIADRVGISEKAVGHHLTYLVDRYKLTPPLRSYTGWQTHALIDYAVAHAMFKTDVLGP